MARVSNPKAPEGESPKLIKYLMDHKHWSPMEMVSMCVEVSTTRDIARQMLRHRSFSFQEFSQRYAEVYEFKNSECRMQDHKNRQNSLSCSDPFTEEWWSSAQDRVIEEAEHFYKKALEKGIAKEVARKLLPEGCTMSSMYMTGSLRSWLHYVGIRCGEETQKEHREVAQSIKHILTMQFPHTMEAFHG